VAVLPAVVGGSNQVTLTVGAGFRMYRLRKGFDPLSGIFSPCSVSLIPDVATDRQRVRINNPGPPIPDCSRVILTGYRSGTRQKFYCACLRVRNEHGSLDGIPYTISSFMVPQDVPSGMYTVRLLPPGADCPYGGIQSADCLPDPCPFFYPNLYIVPSYIVTTLDQLDIDDNSEEQSCIWYGVDVDPAEMTFTFASFSGTNGNTALIKYYGVYPGGADGSGHLTNPNGTSIQPQLPLFVGAEKDMYYDDCVEESLASETDITLECDPKQGLVPGIPRQYTENFQIAFSGVQFNTHSSDLWGKLADGIGDAIDAAIASRVGVPIPLGSALADKVKEKLYSDPVIYFGEKDFQFDLIRDELRRPADMGCAEALPGFAWSLADSSRFQLGGSTKTGGDINMWINNQRVGGPRILQWSVKILSITLLEKYTDPGKHCDVFVNARAYLFPRKPSGGLPATERFPRDSNLSCSRLRTWCMDDGDTICFVDGLAQLLNSPCQRQTVNDGLQINLPMTGLPDNAVESPLIYIEFGFWDDDDSGHDLIGLHSTTVFLTDLLAGGAGGKLVNEHLEGPPLKEELESSNPPVRRVTQTRYAVEHGWGDSDTACGFWDNPFLGPRHPERPKGKIGIKYEISVTWLK